MRRPPCENYGDVDGDGWVTGDDAQMIADYRADIIDLTPDQLRKANVKGYGEVSMTDAMFISQYVENIIDTFPICAELPPPEPEEGIPIEYIIGGVLAIVAVIAGAIMLKR